MRAPIRHGNCDWSQTMYTPARVTPQNQAKKRTVLDPVRSNTAPMN